MWVMTKEIVRRRRGLFSFFLALWSGMAVNANMILVTGAESENKILNFVSKLANAFSTYNLIDLLAFVGAYFLIYRILSGGVKRGFI